MRPLRSVRLISFLTTEVTIKVKFKMSASTYINRSVRWIQVIFTVNVGERIGLTVISFWLWAKGI